ncbi:MAG: hypothetical protein JSR99_14530 [Proteobacteria bacterium]|nr:hypothetical protein [Pseudomonadota bacterium]
MALDQIFTLLSVLLQSVGKVLYGTFLQGVTVPAFLLMSLVLTAGVFIIRAGWHPPAEGRRHLLIINLTTAGNFISFFFALKYVSPAVVASLDLGAALAAAMILARVSDGTSLATTRFVACGGIMAGCLLLSAAEIRILPSDKDPVFLMLALFASAASGITATLSAREAKKLAIAKWTPSEVLAHRFYLSLAIAAVWFVTNDAEVHVPSLSAVPIVLGVAVIAVLVPLLLIQIALRTCDALTLTVCFAAQPLLSFLIALPSPAYSLDYMTLFGVMIVTAFLGLDIISQREQVFLGTAGRRSR